MNKYIIVMLSLIILLTGCNKISNTTQTPIINKSTLSQPLIINNNPIQGTGNIPKINIGTIISQVGEINITENITQDNNLISDAECETDIINNNDGKKVVDFRSFFNDGNGNMIYYWENATKGVYTLSQYCWHGIILDLNKIYSNSTIIVT